MRTQRLQLLGRGKTSAAAVAASAGGAWRLQRLRPSSGRRAAGGRSDQTSVPRARPARPGAVRPPLRDRAGPLPPQASHATQQWRASQLLAAADWRGAATAEGAGCPRSCILLQPYPRSPLRRHGHRRRAGLREAAPRQGACALSQAEQTWCHREAACAAQRHHQLLAELHSPREERGRVWLYVEGWRRCQRKKREESATAASRAEAQTEQTHAAAHPYQALLSPGLLPPFAQLKPPLASSYLRRALPRGREERRAASRHHDKSRAAPNVEQGEVGAKQEGRQCKGRRRHSAWRARATDSIRCRKARHSTGCTSGAAQDSRCRK